MTNILKKGGIQLNNKIYGGVLEALDTIDKALEMAGAPTLLNYYFNASERIFLGQSGVDETRIEIVEKGQGGIY